MNAAYSSCALKYWTIANSVFVCVCMYVGEGGCVWLCVGVCGCVWVCMCVCEVVCGCLFVCV